MDKNTKRKKLTPICVLHYVKLVYRSALLLAAGLCYLFYRLNRPEDLLGDPERKPIILGVVWIVYAVEMAFRFFPSRLESMGCGKQFKRNYVPTGETEPALPSGKRTFAVICAWFALNGTIGFLYHKKVIDKGILILVSLAYGVCDMICILFFCPFQTWFLKNRCCTVCRIYNWDFAMMFTPFVFIPGFYTRSLLGMSLLLLCRWEIALRLHPERFSDRTNACLNCASCEEKLCHHKRQLKSFWKKNRIRFRK